MTILSIDTSCDETAAAVTQGDRVLSNVIWSQAALHAKWGGVVPSLAKRAHQDRLPWVVNKAVHRSQLTIHQISAIAVTVGPGLAPALEAGIHYAKQLALLHRIPLIPVNHLEGHIASVFLRRKSGSSCSPNFPNYPNFPNPFLSLIVSGGHTQLTLSDFSNPSDPSNPSFPSHRILADTLDDALGEALDKAARMLGLGYPGGAILEKFAKQGDPQKYKLPLPLLGKENQGHFSFSGLKTAFYRLVESKKLNKQEIYDLSACFQHTAFEHLTRVVSRTISDYKNYNNYNFYNLLIGGGVATNVELRRRLRKLAKEFNLKVHFPYSKKLCTDNAAMIGLAAQWAYDRGEVKRTVAEINSLDRQPNLNFKPL